MKSSSAQDCTGYGTTEFNDLTVGNEGRRKRLSAVTEKGHYLRTGVQSIPVNDRPRIKRREIQDMTKPLKKWLVNHASNPYPNRNEKQQLAAQSHMNYQQVSNWFTNARRRLKNTVKITDFSWEKSIQLYNSFADSKCEPLFCSDESSFDHSDTDERINKTNSNQKSRSHDTIENLATSSKLLANNDTPSECETTSVLIAEPMPDLNSDAAFNNGIEVGERMMTRQQVQNRQFTDYRVPPNGAFRPPQFKKSIMQRFLNDSCQVSNMSAIAWPQNSAGDRTVSVMDYRYRHTSGSTMGSTDCDDMSSSYFSSCRTTPTAELLIPEDEVSGEFGRHWPSASLNTRKQQPEDMETLELSAVMGLASMAQSSRRRAGATFSKNVIS